MIRVQGIFSTVVPSWAFSVPADDLITSCIEQDITRVLIDTSLHEQTHEKVETANRKNEHEEDQDENGVLEEGYGANDGLNHRPKPFNLVDRAQGS